MSTESTWDPAERGPPQAAAAEGSPSLSWQPGGGGRMGSPGRHDGPSGPAGGRRHQAALGLTGVQVSAPERAAAVREELVSCQWGGGCAEAPTECPSPT